MALLLEALLAVPGGRLGRPALPARPGCLHDLLDDPLRRELAVSQLGALVLGDRADERPEQLEHAGALPVPQPGRGLDVEQRLDARRALLRVLPAGAARP